MMARIICCFVCRLLYLGFILFINVGFDFSDLFPTTILGKVVLGGVAVVCVTGYDLLDMTRMIL